MHKKALKVLGILFSIALVVFCTVVLVDSCYSHTRSFNYSYYAYSTVDFEDYNELGEAYLNNSKSMIEVNAYSAERLASLDRNIKEMKSIIFVFGIFAGVGLFILSVCIKPDKKEKKAKAVQAPPAPAAVQLPVQQPVQTFSQPVYPQPQPQPQNEFCSNCGAVVPAGQSFCIQCGYIQN